MAKTRRETSPEKAPAELDEFDYEILTQVQQNNQLSSHEIGEKVGLSPSAVQRRLRQLRETGVIMADVSLVSPAAIGRRVVVIVEVSLEREGVQHMREFERGIAAEPEVTQCYYVTGNFDFIVVLNMPSMEAYGEFAKRVFHANANVKEFCTAVVIDQLKFTTRIDLSRDRKR